MNTDGTAVIRCSRVAWRSVASPGKTLKAMMDIATSAGLNYETTLYPRRFTNPYAAKCMWCNRGFLGGRKMVLDMPMNSNTSGKFELDRQFRGWASYLNEWGTTAFGLFLACLGTAEHKHLCAVLSSALLSWGYGANCGRFPIYITHFRKKQSPGAKSLERAIWLEKLYKRPMAYFPFFLGVGTLATLAIWPAVDGNWKLYVSFIPL